MKNVWDRIRNRKEGAFIRSIWYRAVVVESWSVRLITDVDDKCQMCMAYMPETIAHKLWDCRVAGGLGTSHLVSSIP